MDSVTRRGVRPALTSCFDPSSNLNQAVDFLQCLSCNPLKITIHASRGLDHPPDLLLAFGPKTCRCLSFPFEVSLHVGKLLDNGFNSLTKPRACQVLIDQLHLLYLALQGSSLLLFLR